MNTELPEIKPYNDCYRKQVLSVWESSVRATHDFLDRRDFEEIKELVQTIDFNAFTVWCLMLNNRVTGFIGVTGNHIEMLFIAPDYFGRGFGKMLLHVATSKLKANKVDVNEQNINAVNFYRKLGFDTYDRSEKDSQGKNYPILKMRLKIQNG